MVSFVASSYIVWVVFTGEEERGPFYGSSQGNIYHYPWCSYVNKTKAENLIKFSTALEADIRGYNPCDICDPPEPSDPHVVEIIIVGLVPAYIGLILAAVKLYTNINPAPAQNQTPHQRNNTQQLTRNPYSTSIIQKIITISLIRTVLVTPIIGPITAQAQYIGSKESNIYHLPTCQYAKQINPENRIEFANEQEALSKGYRPCLLCIIVTISPIPNQTDTPSHLHPQLAPHPLPNYPGQFY